MHLVDKKFIFQRLEAIYYLIEHEETKERRNNSLLLRQSNIITKTLNNPFCGLDALTELMCQVAGLWL